MTRVFRYIRSWFYSAGLTLVALPCAAAPTYTATNLGTLGGAPTSGWSINASGQVAGSGYTSDNAYRAFLYDGAIHDIGTLGGPTAVAWASTPTDGSLVMQTPATPASMPSCMTAPCTTSARWVAANTALAGTSNSSGQVTGYSTTSGDAGQHAFLYDGAMHDIGTLGGTQSAGYGINDSGRVTGYSYTSGDAGQHAFLYDGAMHDIGTLGGKYIVSEGYGINASGQVVGDLYGGNGQRAFLYDGGIMYDLNTLLAPTDPLYGMVTLIGAIGINDAGQIVAGGYLGGFGYSYLLTPVVDPVASAVPEPTSLALLGAGVFGVLYAHRQGRRAGISHDTTCVEA